MWPAPLMLCLSKLIYFDLFRINDVSIVKDFLAETFAAGVKLDVLSIENAPAVIGHCMLLVQSKHESHQVTGVKAVG